MYRCPKSCHNVRSLNAFWWFILRMTRSFSQQSQRFDCNTHYLPSLVHPTLAMYSVPGNKEVNGTASSLSCVLTICKYKHTHIRNA